LAPAGMAGKGSGSEPDVPSQPQPEEAGSQQQGAPETQAAETQPYAAAVALQPVSGPKGRTGGPVRWWSVCCMRSVSHAVRAVRVCRRLHVCSGVRSSAVHSVSHAGPTAPGRGKVHPSIPPRHPATSQETHTCMHALVRACTHSNTRACTHMHAQHPHTHIHAHAHACKHTRIRLPVRDCIGAQFLHHWLVRGCVHSFWRADC